MKKLCFPLLFTVSVLLKSFMLFAQTKENSKLFFVCPPCGASCDTLVFHQAGICPNCSMKLLRKSVIDNYKNSLLGNDIDSNDNYYKELPAIQQTFKNLNGFNIESEQFDAFIKRQVDSLDIPALSIAILNDNNLVYYQAIGYKNTESKDTCDNKTLFEAASMTKPIFAYLVLKLSKESLIDLDKPLYKYLPNPDLQYDKRYKKITARMILSHTSGLPNWREGKLKLEAIPGTKFIYSGEGFEYLGKVVEKILKKDLNKIMLEQVLIPLQMKKSFLVENDYLNHHISLGYRKDKPPGRDTNFVAYPAYGLRTNAIDYAKFIATLAKDDLFKLMTTEQKEVEPNKWICLGIVKRNTENGAKFYHSGNNANRFTGRFEIYPGKKISYVFFMNCDKEGAFMEALNNYLSH